MMTDLWESFPVASTNQSQTFGLDVGMNGVEGDTTLYGLIPTNGPGASW